MARIGANSPKAIQNPGSLSGRLESFPVQGTFPRQPSPTLTSLDRGLWLSRGAIRRQLAAMPHDLFLIRLIHQATRRPFPGERIWAPTDLLNPATVRFLRIRNREGCDVYIWPYAENQNAGYILLDLIGPRRRFSKRCAPMVMSPVSFCRLVPVISRPGFASTCCRWNPPWPPRSGSTWPISTEQIWPAPTGATWEDWPGSPIRNCSGAHAAATLPG